MQILIFTTLKKSHYIKGNIVGKGEIAAFETMRFSKLMLFSETLIVLTCRMHHLSFGTSPFHAEIYTSTFFMWSTT